MLESPLHQSQPPGEIQLIQVFSRTNAVAAPMLLSLGAHTGSSKGVQRQRSCDLGCHLPRTSLELCGCCWISFDGCHLSSGSFVLCSSADTTMVPPHEAAGNSPLQGCGGNLHQSQWLARPSFYLWWGFLLAKCSQHLKGWMLLGACGGREERCGDPRCFPFREHPGFKENGCFSPQLGSPQVMVIFLLHLKHPSASPLPMEGTIFLSAAQAWSAPRGTE